MPSNIREWEWEVKQARGGGTAWVWALSESSRKSTRQGLFHELTGFPRMRRKWIGGRRKKKNLLFPKLSFTGQMEPWAGTALLWP
ncbi:hypothetical protein DF270_16045 [Listeria monocytogenes]|nr:hypothetical protein DF270_16045 [Listeria monocytogenes]